MHIKRDTITDNRVGINIYPQRHNHKKVYNWNTYARYQEWIQQIKGCIRAYNPTKIRNNGYNNSL